MRSLWVCRSSHEGSPSLCGVFPSRFPRAALFKTANSPSGLQVPVPFKAFGLGLCRIFCGDQSGPRSHSVACLCGGHLALRRASTMCAFGASTSPFSTAKASWGQSGMAGAFSRHAPPASSGSPAVLSGGFKRVGRCAASCCSGSTPLPGFKSRSRVSRVASQGAERRMKRFWERQPARCLHSVRYVFAPPRAELTLQNRCLGSRWWCPDRATDRCARRHSRRGQDSTPYACRLGPSD